MEWRHLFLAIGVTDFGSWHFGRGVGRRGRSAPAAVSRQGVLISFLLLWLADPSHETRAGQVDFVRGRLRSMLWRSGCLRLLRSPHPSAFVGMHLLLTTACLVVRVVVLGPVCSPRNHLWGLTCMRFMDLLLSGSRRLLIGSDPVGRFYLCVWAQCL